MTTRELTPKELELAAMTAEAYVERRNAEANASEDEDTWTQLSCDSAWKTGLDAARTVAVEELNECFEALHGNRPGRADVDEMSLDDIEEAVNGLRAELDDEGDFDYDDPMDGDHESALASAGMGVDEDYGCFDGGDDW